MKVEYYMFEVIKNESLKKILSGKQSVTLIDDKIKKFGA